VNFSLPVYFPLFFSSSFWGAPVDKFELEIFKRKNQMERSIVVANFLFVGKNKLERITAIMKRRRIKIKDPRGK